MVFARQAGNVLRPRPGSAASSQDRSGPWLRNAAAGLCLLAAAAATVSFTAQYRLVDATRHLTAIAALEAAIPDAALVFASLGVALALHGRRALRARTLNLASVGTSVFMNTIAAAPDGEQRVPPAALLPRIRDLGKEIEKVLAAGSRHERRCHRRAVSSWQAM